MQPNRVKARLKEGKAVAGPIISEMRTVGGVKLMARGGFDFLFLDTEHAMIDYETLLNLVQMSLMCDIAPLVRPTDTTYAHVARALDTGAQGVIIPRVESREQAEAVVQFAKYPPVGRRGAGGDGRNAYLKRGVLEAIEAANEESLVVLQIESVEGVGNVDEIAAVEGVDVVMIGPQDLSISLGCHGDFSHQAFTEAAEKVVDACRKNNIASGMVEKNAADLRRWHDMGMRFLVCNSDSNMLVTAAAQDVETLREFTGAEA